ncbi:cellulose biosynthesis cyclic di-GMP-binding regulatory protein BcsB [Agrobacterium sp. a22-2]|uniref:cellulose biosynthesis cyclic di-GMP-binding regulatory protein BcsB n=1 Tax=Agrobacterium sp. a22-2 TaxID=2283840 RepID=UPI001446390D|nr:cellulose biosynthesis cyclic di-GMP-binding regulatory protein BcsB [Agrobacterium sp. a22-2]NKN35598.1 cellulose biosynthesis cyclic di-GMP-binding regulatory protein BcsB [Agrobacterium sp. a22-2]
MAKLPSATALFLTLSAGLFAAPGLAASLQLLPGAEPATAGGEQAPTYAATIDGRLVPFEQSGDTLRLIGEDAARLLSFHLSGEQARQPGTLRIAYTNAVSVLPDDAIMDVEVNGRAVGSFAIRSSNGFLTEQLALSPTDLIPGRNSVRLRARQHHRVDCSLDAVYELWTQVDPVQSGFVTRAAGQFATLDDLLAIGRTGEGVTELRLISPEGDRSVMAADSLATVQALALYLNRDDLKISIADKPGEGAGIDLYFGDTRSYPQTAKARLVLAGAPNGLSVRGGGTADRAAVIMHGASPADLSASLKAAVGNIMRPGFEAGVLNARPGMVDGTETGRVTLADAGYRTAPFTGRLFRTTLDIDMPADFYPGDYGAIDFYLKAATAPGLAPGAQLLFRVNERAVTSHVLYNPEGATFDGKRIELPLRAFHPGVNQVEILAELPMEADKACEPAGRSQERPRFLLLEDSAFEFPDVAHIGRLPDLAAFSGKAYPFQDAVPFDVHVDRPDGASLGAAMTMVTRLALAAKKPLNASLKVGAPDASADRDALIVTANGRQDGVPSRSDSKPVASTVDDAGQIDMVKTAAIGSAIAGGPDMVSQSEALLDAFQQSTALEDENLSLKTRVWAWMSKASRVISHWLKYEDAVDEVARLDRSDVLVSMTQTRAPLGNGVWTVVEADSPQDLEAGVRGLTAPAVWGALKGGTALMKRDGHSLVTYMPVSYSFSAPDDTSLANLRRLAAAWLSDHFQIYVLLVIACMGLFGLWLGYAVPRKGVRTDQ